MSSSLAVMASAHCFHMETFFNGYEALTLGTHLGPVRPQIVVPRDSPYRMSARPSRTGRGM